ncbi:MAG: hypothetical protein JSV52_14430 [Candidatus Zixiibacteriota bacterium]|nr:MAG: hypothetical protein JSV52_14430 [candidate division Zixibacteria bacterium]
MKTSQHLLAIALILVTSATVAGCGEDNPLNSFDPQVTNSEDLFTFRASNVYLVTTRLTYDWNCTGQTASIEHSSGRSNGTGVIYLFDANGTQVYQSELKSTGTEYSQAGTPGSWKVVLDFSEYSGAVYCRVRKL